jgi:serine/threonine protein kinase
MPFVGQSIDRYRVLEQLGQGGMAVVYKAYDTRLERDVALKVIRTEYIRPIQLDKLMQRFEREAKAQAKFAHNNIVHVYDYGAYKGAPYIVMEYLSGGTLKSQTGQPMPYQQAARLLAPIADALAYAHDRNVLHRDVKPSNILITEVGKPVLTDFGIAKILEVEGTAITDTGMGIGTPEYMAPEQWRGQPFPQTDIYALGVVFYELVTGRKPYTADTPTAIAVMQVMEPLPRPSRLVHDLPAKVEKVLYKALAVRPEDRYGNMTEFAQVLKEFSEDGIAEREWGTPIPMGEAEETEAQLKQIATRTPVSMEDTSDDLISPPVSTERKKKLSRLWMSLGLLFAIVVIGGGIGLGLFYEKIVGMRAPETPTLTITPKATRTVTPTYTQFPTDTQTYTPAPIAVIGSTLIREKDGMEMSYIPAGEFDMGMSEGINDESLGRTVYLDAFWIDKYEVTNMQFASFLNEMGNQNEEDGNWLDIEDKDVNIHKSEELWSADSGYGNHPVVEVSWDGAVAYCTWVGGRLPTEAEWEKAARGGLVGRLYPWGNDSPVCTLGAENGAQYSYCGGGHKEVGSFAPNGYDLYDMAGNVYEWVMDWYAVNYYDSSPAENPLGPSDGEYRVLRGGSWYLGANTLLVFNRSFRSPDFTLSYIGFRCASNGN